MSTMEQHQINFLNYDLISAIYGIQNLLYSLLTIKLVVEKWSNEVGGGFLLSYSMQLCVSVALSLNDVKEKNRNLFN